MIKNKRTKRLELRLTEKEYSRLVEEAKNYQSLADYIRMRTFSNGVALIDPKEFIRVMDDILSEMKRVGNNINQFAKYVNTVGNVTPENVIREFDKELDNYMKLEDKLNVTWRKIMKSV